MVSNSVRGAAARELTHLEDDVMTVGYFMRRSQWRLGTSLPVLFFVASSPGALSAQVGAPPAPPRADLAGLRAYVERFTGADPSDCGQHALTRASLPASAKDLQRALACAFAAAKDREPFWTFKQDQGIDSLLFQGFLGTVDGTVYQFWYDSAPCGGPACAGRFSLSRCDKPTVLVHRNARSDFGCDDLKQGLNASPEPLIPRSPIPDPETVIPTR
jgi:hypothetical protein